MSSTELKQRLMAILAADAAGYSRLMAADEPATVESLEAARAIFKSQIEGHQGHVIDMAGDSVLAVFETAIGAVTAALAIQRELEATAGGIPEGRRMRFRMGVHLGDVIERADGTVFGDGVNVAARLQALSAPGGVMVSAVVHEAVRDRMPARFDDQGEHELKNIARPVHVFRVDSGMPGIPAASEASKKVAPPGHRRIWHFFALAASLLALAIGAWIAAADSAKDAREWFASMLGRKAAQAPSVHATIAVMPFANQSGDPKRDYFSDGVTEDIINALGRFSALRVMSRNAVEPFKIRPATPQAVRGELGVRYVAKGSVREADGRLRVAVELSDAEKGTVLWSERYEGEGQAVFDIQDRIVRNIVGTLAGKLSRLERERASTKPVENLEAYDLVLRARELIYRVTRDTNRQARDLLARAVQLAPNYAEAYVALAHAEYRRADQGWMENPEEGMRRVEAYARRALSIEDTGAHARAHAQLARVYSHLGNLDQALAEANRAIELNPSDPVAQYALGDMLVWLGRIEEGIAVLETARRFDPTLDNLMLPLGYYLMKRYREALADADGRIARNPEVAFLHAVRAATLGQMGQTEEAGNAVAQLRRLAPFAKVELFGTNFKNPDHAAKFHEGLRRAGM